MKSLESRVEELEEASGIGDYRPTVLCADGSTWELPQDVSSIMSWVLHHGRQTPDGREIVDMIFDDPPDHEDALSAALRETDRDIASGKLDVRATIDALNSKNEWP